MNAIFLSFTQTLCSAQRVVI